MKEPDDIRPGSGNVFADLDLPAAAELHTKAQIAWRICGILAERKLTQRQAAAALGIDQPKVSALMRGRLGGFSTDRLLRFLTALNRDVEIVIRPAAEKTRAGTAAPGRIRVLAPA